MGASEVIVQGLGLVAAALMISSFQCRINRHLFALQLGATSLFALQFFFLGGLTGTFVLLIGVARNLFALQFHKGWPRQKRWMFFFLTAYIGATFFTYENIFSLLPLLSMLVGTIAVWTDNRGLIRLANLCIACPAWLIYDTYIRSYGGIINEIFIIASILISIKRYGFRSLMEEKE